jgi:hypothetical protein
MSLDQKASRVRTSSALVRRACTLAPEPDSYPLAIGYLLAAQEKIHHRDAENTKYTEQFFFRNMKPLGNVFPT